MIGKLLSKKKDRIRGYRELDKELRKIIMSASGNVGGNVCDALFPHAASDAQRSYLMMEAGFFGVAVSSYFYVLRYRKKRDLEAFAKAAFEEYKAHSITSRHEIPEDQRRMLDEIYTREGFPAIEAYIRALKRSEDSPEEGMVALKAELVSRIDRLGGITLSTRAEEVAQSKIIENAQALMQSFRHFFG